MRIYLVYHEHEINSEIPASGCADIELNVNEDKRNISASIISDGQNYLKFLLQN